MLPPKSSMPLRAGEHRNQFIWNPEVHQRFNEQLYYFLLAVKPFDAKQYVRGLTRLMDAHGVQRYCSYQVFGNFDCLIRVWLLPQHARQFVEETQYEIHNVQSILTFQATKKRLCWAFEKKPDQRLISRVTTDEVRSVQTLMAERPLDLSGDATVQTLLDGGLIRLVEASKGIPNKAKNSSLIKAYIAFSEPTLATKLMRDRALDEMEGMLQDPARKLSQITFIEGIGFCWALSKLLAPSLDAIGKLTADLADKFGPLGIGTSTFLINSGFPVIEGDAISETALTAKTERNSEVAMFLPSLYTPRTPPLSSAEIGEFEDFVTNKLLRSRDDDYILSDDDREVLRRFLVAVLNDSRDEAFVSVYLRLASAEGRIRDPLRHLAGRIYGGPEKLIASLPKVEGAHAKDFKSLTLLDALRAAKKLLGEALPDDAWVRNLKDDHFQKVADLRNRVMHHKEFEPRTDWKEFAERALLLFELRDKIETRYASLMEKYSEA